MKCDYCGNEKVWVGSMHGGGLDCEHCINNDDPAPSVYEASEQYVVTPKGSATISVCGGGGLAGSAPPVAGGSGGHSPAFAPCWYCGSTGVVWVTDSRQGYCPKCGGSGAIKC